MVDRLQAADGVGSHRKQRNSAGSSDREGRRGSRDGSDSKWWGGERISRLRQGTTMMQQRRGQSRVVIRGSRGRWQHLVNVGDSRGALATDGVGSSAKGEREIVADGSSKRGRSERCNLSQSSSHVNFFGWEGPLAAGGAEGLGAASQVVTLVLRASWFNRSS
ncbi:hypothetical protein BHM03_00044774 [Ensete ventricosum]|nr:hypothetical protein BHM03_00044774 [Ensete ventricosum]